MEIKALPVAEFAKNFGVAHPVAEFAKNFGVAHPVAEFAKNFGKPIFAGKKSKF